MSSINDTQPNSPFQTNPHPPDQSADQNTGPGCMAWGLLGLAALAFSLIVVIVSGLTGYLTGQTQVDSLIGSTQQAQVDQYLADIPTRIAEGNTAFIEGYIDWFAELTPAPPELAGLIATGTQLAIDLQPTLTPVPSITPTATATEIVPTEQVTNTAVPTSVELAAEDAPLFDPATLFAEAETQIANGEFDEAIKTLDAVQAVDPTFRTQEVQDLIFQTLRRQAEMLLRSGNPANLSVGIVKANDAERYGDIGDLSYERYIAGLYLNAQSQEVTNPEGAIGGYSEIYVQAPNYIDVRNKLFSLRIEVGDVYLEATDFCPAEAQYEAALQLLNSPEVEIKLETAQSGCGGDSVDGSSGSLDSVNSEADETGTPTAPEGQSDGGVAPIGERP